MDVYAQAGFNQANTADATAQAGFNQANTANNTAESAFNQANTANTTAQAGFDKANTVDVYAQSAFNQANTADTTAQAAFNNSNTKFSTSGGLITGDTSITGNLTISGNFSTVNTSIIQVTDSMIALAVNNSTDIVDIGFYGHYTNANTVNVHTGLVRDASDKIYYLFDESVGEPGSTIDFANSRIATVNANIISQSVTVSGFNILNYTTSAYNQANLASTTAQSAFNQANTANATAQAGFNQANTADGTAQSAFTQANTANTRAQAGFDKANTDFTNISIAGGTFGNTTTIPTVTVAANGRISSISSVSFTAGASLADDTSTNANYFPIFATANTGTPTTIYVSSSKLLYNPSSGTITVVDLNTTSDIKYKENVEPIESAINILKNVNGVSFNWKETGSKSYGVVAQELEKILPELVHSTERGLSVSYLPLIAILIEAVKEQQKQIDELKNKQ